MADVDKDLAKALQMARKKPQNFAIIAKGANVLKLLVDRKPLKDATVLAAKKECQGNAVLKGVVVGGEGTELVFQVTDPPSVGEVKLRKFITDEAKLVLKARFEVVSDLREVEDQDDDIVGAEPKAVQTEVEPTDVPPPAPPTPDAGPNKTPTAEQLLAALNKFSPAIKQAVADHPQRKAEILKPVTVFQAHLKANELPEAKAALLELGGLLKSLAAGGATPPRTSEAPSESPDSEYEALYRGLLETVPTDLQRLRQSDPVTAEKLQKVVAGAAGFAQQGDFQRASKYLEEAAAALARAFSASRVQEASAEIPENVVQDRKKFLASRWQTALGGVRVEVEKLRPKVAELLAGPSAGALLDGVHQGLDRFCADLSDAITGADKASSGDLKPLDAALSVIRDYRKRVQSDERIQVLAEARDALGVQVDVSGVLLSALGELETRLAG